MKKIASFLWKYTVIKPVLFVLMLFCGVACFIIMSINITLQTNSTIYGKVTQISENQVKILLNDSINSDKNILYVYENRNIQVLSCENFVILGDIITINEESFPYSVGTDVCIEYPTGNETLFHIIFVNGGNY